MTEFRKANIADTDKVLDFYHRMIEEMHGTNFDVLWKRDVHPSDSYLRSSIEQGNMTICIEEDGNIASALIIDGNYAPGYEKAPWIADVDDDQIGIVHSVATRPAYQGRGLAKKTMLAAIEFAEADGLRSLRLDTFPDNSRSHGLYNSVGFVDHGLWDIYYEYLGEIKLKLFEYVI